VTYFVTVGAVEIRAQQKREASADGGLRKESLRAHFHALRWYDKAASGRSRIMTGADRKFGIAEILLFSRSWSWWWWSPSRSC